MLKKCKLVMLPSNQKAPIADNHGRLVLANGAKDKLFDTSRYIEGDKDLKLQHLYLLSNEEIKEGDWCYGLLEGNLQIFQYKKEYGEMLTPRKIIATTDSSLSLVCTCGTNKKVPTGLCSNCGKFTNTTIPQPSQSFIEKYIEKYNKGEQITEVMVEYDYYPGEWATELEECPWLDEKCELKVNPKDNTITIKPVKSSWTREEVVNLLERWTDDKYAAKSSGLPLSLEEWISQNL